MVIAAAQMNSVDELEINFRSVEAIAATAAKMNPRPAIVFFPENTLFLRIGLEQDIQFVDLQSDWITKLKALSVSTQIAFHITTPVLDNGLRFNGSILILGDKAELIYRKIHLFDIDLQGQRPMRESDTFSSGKQPSTFKVGDFSFGSTICYDVRFSELFLTYAKQQVDAIVVPSAFLMKTGKSHWLTLLRARAIESQCYIIAPAQEGVHVSRLQSNESRETYGHSVIIDPWGDVLAEKQSGCGLIAADLRKDFTKSVRLQMPMLQHRRL